jgi:uncharacterized membrane protein
MLKLVLAYAGSLAVMLVLDLLWLAVIAKNLYQSALGSLLADSPKLGAAAVFYLLYPAGVLYFAIAPALASGSPLQAAGRGALFGFFAYMTYEFTNLALIREWPASLVAIDIAWGVALTAVMALGGYAAARWVG